MTIITVDPPTRVRSASVDAAQAAATSATAQAAAAATSATNAAGSATSAGSSAAAASTSAAGAATSATNASTSATAAAGSATAAAGSATAAAGSATAAATSATNAAESAAGFGVSAYVDVAGATYAVTTGTNGDAGKTIYCANAGGCVVTLPANAPKNFYALFVQAEGAGQITFAFASGAANAMPANMATMTKSAYATAQVVAHCIANANGTSARWVLRGEISP